MRETKLESNPEHTKAQWGNSFGYIMVAAGAAIGLGNIWRFPYLAYAGGGGAFLVAYIILSVVFGYPIVKMESTVGRYGKSNAAADYGSVNKKFRFVGAVNIFCEFFVGVFYIVVSGWVLKYLVAFATGVDFGTDPSAFFDRHIEKSVSPNIYAGIVMVLVVFLLFSGITQLVEKVSKVIMPALLFILLACAVWALIKIPGAAKGLRYYLVPDFHNFTWKVFADVCSQVMFSVGIGCGIYSTLGASIPESHNIKKDSLMVIFCDTLVAFVAGLLVIPSVVGSGMEMTSGKALVFEAMTMIFGNLPGGRAVGTLFFAALFFAVISTYVTVIEIPTVYVQEVLKTTHKKALVITSSVVYFLSIFVSLGFGVLKNVRLPWPFATGIQMYDFYDWLDCFTGYFLMPLGCLLICFFTVKVWGMERYGKELLQDGRDGKITWYDKFSACVICPVILVIVLLNVFGFIK